MIYILISSYKYFELYHLSSHIYGYIYAKKCWKKVLLTLSNTYVSPRLCFQMFGLTIKHNQNDSTVIIYLKDWPSNMTRFWWQRKGLCGDVIQVQGEAGGVFQQHFNFIFDLIQISYSIKIWNTFFSVCLLFGFFYRMMRMKKQRNQRPLMLKKFKKSRRRRRRSLKMLVNLKVVLQNIY